MCIECEATDAGCLEIELRAGKFIVGQVEANDRANVTRTRDRYVSPDSGGPNVTVVCVVAANFVPVWKRDIGVAAQPTILVGQSV